MDIESNGNKGNGTHRSIIAILINSFKVCLISDPVHEDRGQLPSASSTGDTDGIKVKLINKIAIRI